jgi:thiol-disulfide isomerase/thioredoxin
MYLRAAIAIPALWLTASGGVVDEVRASIAAKDFAGAERMVENQRRSPGPSPELAQAVSWVARGYLAIKNYDRAEAFAAQAREMSLQALGKRALDSDPWLPIALGAAIEVHGQVLNARGEKAEALEYLRGEFKKYGKTSLAERIQKNVNLISLEGKPAPPLEAREWIGPRPAPLASFKGRPVLLFFWAHWCPDCKELIPVLAKLEKTYGPRGLALVGPTRYYGYVAGGEDAPPAAEKKYIEEIRRTHYAALAGMPVPLSNANFITYGSSSTPTLVLLDKQGAVNWYHPGTASEKELAGRIESVLR